MDTGSFVIGIGGLVVGLLGVVVAGFSLLLSYKARTSLYRERLYSKQLEIYPQIIQAQVSLHEEMLSVITRLIVFARQRNEDNERWLRDSVREANRQWVVCHKLSDCNLPVLSKELVEKIGRYQAWAARTIDQADPISEDQKEQRDDGYFGRLMSDYLALHEAILQAARRDLGTDPLTQEALKLIGEIKVRKNQE